MTKKKMKEKFFGKKTKLHIIVPEDIDVREISEGHIRIGNEKDYCIIKFRDL